MRGRQDPRYGMTHGIGDSTRRAMSVDGDHRGVQNVGGAAATQPRVRVGVLDRPRVVAVFERLEGARLLLVSAAAGSGKTVAVASWLRGRRDLSVAWVTVERGETAARELWTSVAIAVDRLRSGIARPALAKLRAPDSTVAEAIDELLRRPGRLCGADRDRSRRPPPYDRCGRAGVARICGGATADLHSSYRDHAHRSVHQAEHVPRSRDPRRGARQRAGVHGRGGGGVSGKSRHHRP